MDHPLIGIDARLIAPDIPFDDEPRLEIRVEKEVDRLTLAELDDHINLLHRLREGAVQPVVRVVNHLMWALDVGQVEAERAAQVLADKGHVLEDSATAWWVLRQSPTTLRVLVNPEEIP